MAASIGSHFLWSLKWIPRLGKTGARNGLRVLARQDRLSSHLTAQHSSSEDLQGNGLPTDTNSDSVKNREFEEALQHEDLFQLKSLVTTKDLYQARVHLGHNKGLRHESMTPFIFGERLGRDIIDLEQTLPLLHQALNLCAHIVFRGGMVLFLCRNAQVVPLVEKMAREVNEYSHCRTWKSGIFTNASHTFNTLPIYPDLCVFFNTLDTVFEQHRAVVESSKLLIPSVGFVDTNCDAQHISYPIPANDDTPDALRLYIDLFRTAVLRAKAHRKSLGLEER